MEDTTTAEAKAIIASGALQTLIGALTNEGYTVLGPTVRDGAIVYDEIARLEDLPAGWTDRQDAATYTLERREDNALFGYAVGPQSWKRFLHPPCPNALVRAKDGRGVRDYPCS